MKTHIRHRQSKRNARKARHHMKCLRKDAKDFWKLAAKMRKILAQMNDKARYIEGRLCRLENRVECDE